MYFTDVTSEVNNFWHEAPYNNKKLKWMDWFQVNKGATNKYPCTYTLPLTETCFHWPKSGVLYLRVGNIILLQNDKNNFLHLRKRWLSYYIELHSWKKGHIILVLVISQHTNLRCCYLHITFYLILFSFGKICLDSERKRN